LLYVPRLLHLAEGCAEGLTPLTAFDNALRAAGIDNLNLIRVSSIVPQGATFGPRPHLPVGTLVPTVYTQVTSNVPGEVISAVIGGGIGEQGGVLMEYHHRGRGDDAVRVVTAMVEEGFAKRGWKLDDVHFACAEHTVERLGCAAAAVLMLDSVPVGVPQTSPPDLGEVST
jgi:arginine decarboxylase